MNSTSKDNIDSLNTSMNCKCNKQTVVINKSSTNPDHHRNKMSSSVA